jgi:hypothetical protein
VLWKYHADAWRLQQQRTWFLPYQEQLHHQVQQQLLQIRHEGLLKYSKGLYKWESGFGLDNQRALKLIVGTPIHQLFRYNRINGRLHLSGKQQRKNM